jgi:hypothetical protein
MTLSALGIFSAAGAGGGGATGTYELIESYILGSNQSEVSFSSLATYASTYKHLQIRMVALGTTSVDNQFIRFNSDSGNNYNGHFLFGDGSSVGSTVYTPKSQIYIGNSSVTANQFTAVIVDILDAFSSTKNKTVRALYGSVGTPSVVQLISGAWFNTASLTSISVARLTNNYATGSRFSLYGLR